MKQNDYRSDSNLSTQKDLDLIIDQGIDVLAEKKLERSIIWEIANLVYQMGFLGWDFHFGFAS